MRVIFPESFAEWPICSLFARSASTYRNTRIVCNNWSGHHYQDITTGTLGRFCHVSLCDIRISVTNCSCDVDNLVTSNRTLISCLIILQIYSSTFCYSTIYTVIKRDNLGVTQKMFNTPK